MANVASNYPNKGGAIRVAKRGKIKEKIAEEWLNSITNLASKAGDGLGRMVKGSSQAQTVEDQNFHLDQQAATLQKGIPKPDAYED